MLMRPTASPASAARPGGNMRKSADPVCGYTMYGRETSFYTSKLRTYLVRKGIPFTEKSPNMWFNNVTIPRHIGVVATPVLISSNGEWLFDTKAIIDRFEVEYPTVRLIPDTPVQTVAALLFEMWVDEMWIPTALAVRWCHMEENYPFLEKDVVGALLPGWPRWLQRRAGHIMSKRMLDLLPQTGVTPEQEDLLHRWTVQQLDWLEAHFATTPFVLGQRPTIADVAFNGPLYAHFSRDPWPGEHLINPRPSLKAWIKTMNRPGEILGELEPGDQFPPTLEPMMSSLLRDLLVYLDGNLAELQKAVEARPAGGTIDRFLGEITIPMLDGHFRRRSMPFVLWMLQRIQDKVGAMPDQDRAKVVVWLGSYGAERLLDLKVPRLKRNGLNIALDRQGQ
ncbi:MAG: glutathione S-transferase family protein [Burkholderiales bacterium]